MSDVRAAVHFLPPAHFAVRRADGVHVLDAIEGTALHVQGPLADALLGAPADVATLRAAGALLPDLGRLHEALGPNRFGPLRRADLLRGSGYRVLFLELTSKCNENCSHCYAESGPERSEALDLPVIERVTRDARRLGFSRLQLTGGDPLVSPHVIAAAETALEEGFRSVEVYTNGLRLLHPRLAELLSLPVDFALSIYSHDAATHDEITRTPGSHRRTVEALRRLLDLGRRVRVGIIAMETNQDEVRETHRWLVEEEGLDAARIRVDVSRSVGRGHHRVPASRLTRGSSLPPAERSSSPPARASTIPPRQRTLGGRACVSSDGSVFPCIFSRSIPLGNVHRTSLREILEDEEPVTASVEGLLGASADFESRLTCSFCRLRAALLGGDPCAP